MPEHTDLYHRGWRWSFDLARLKFEPRDLWVGICWNKAAPHFDGGWWGSFTLYICLLPCLPIILRWSASSPACDED